MAITTHSLWLPAFAMAASALVPHFHISQDTRRSVDDMEWEGDTVIAPVPLLAEYTRLGWSRENTSTFITSPVAKTLAEPVESRDIWERLRAGFSLPLKATPSVQAQINNFRNHPRHVEQILERGQLYLSYILGRVEERGLPTELVLLPAIESAFDPFSTSPAGAAGIWQFMPVTAKYVGLRQDWWFDGRRDILAATEAALDYLSELHQSFNGDWPMALGAYNAGRARVNEAIRLNRSRGKPVDLWHLSLPEETRGYVPKLIALRAIISNPDAYNITLPDLPITPHFTVVDTGGRLDLQVAAQLTGTSVEELQRLNPGLIRSTTPPVGQHRLLVPSSKATLFRDRLAVLPNDQRVQSITYRIRLGDTLSAIARYAQTTVARLRQLNRLDNSNIIAGRLLIIPTDDPVRQPDLAMQASLM